MSVCIAYISPFVPAEWIEAHGLRARRVQAEGGVSAAAGACPLATAFAQCAGDRDAVVFTTTCDQMRRMAERCCSDPSRVFLMNVPATWETAEAFALYTDELRRLGRFMVRLGGIAPAAEQLATVMREHDIARRSGAVVVDRGTPVAMVGAPLRREDRWLFDCVNHAGGCVALDATEGGQRCWPAQFDERGMAADPLAELARKYFLTIPDAFRRPDTLLQEYLQREVALRKIRGVILVRYLWCDQWHAQLVRMKESLKIPVIEIDLGGQDHDLPRIRTRIESLIGILR